MHKETNLKGAKIARRYFCTKTNMHERDKIARRQVCTKGQFCTRVKNRKETKRKV